LSESPAIIKQSQTQPGKYPFVQYSAEKEGATRKNEYSSFRLLCLSLCFILVQISILSFAQGFEGELKSPNQDATFITQPASISVNNGRLTVLKDLGTTKIAA
jgi:hypothetical protein